MLHNDLQPINTNASSMASSSDLTNHRDTTTKTYIEKAKDQPCEPKTAVTDRTCSNYKYKLLATSTDENNDSQNYQELANNSVGDSVDTPAKLDSTNTIEEIIIPIKPPKIEKLPTVTEITELLPQDLSASLTHDCSTTEKFKHNLAASFNEAKPQLIKFISQCRPGFLESLNEILDGSVDIEDTIQLIYDLSNDAAFFKNFYTKTYDDYTTIIMPKDSMQDIITKVKKQDRMKKLVPDNNPLLCFDKSSPFNDLLFYLLLESAITKDKNIDLLVQICVVLGQNKTFCNDIVKTFISCALIILKGPYTATIKTNLTLQLACLVANKLISAEEIKSLESKIIKSKAPDNYHHLLYKFDQDDTICCLFSELNLTFIKNKTKILHKRALTHIEILPCVGCMTKLTPEIQNAIFNIQSLSQTENSIKLCINSYIQKKAKNPKYADLRQALELHGIENLRDNFNIAAVYPMFFMNFIGAFETLSIDASNLEQNVAMTAANKLKIKIQDVHPELINKLFMYNYNAHSKTIAALVTEIVIALYDNYESTKIEEIYGFILLAKEIDSLNIDPDIALNLLTSVVCLLEMNFASTTMAITKFTQYLHEIKPTSSGRIKSQTLAYAATKAGISLFGEHI